MGEIFTDNIEMERVQVNEIKPLSGNEGWISDMEMDSEHDWELYRKPKFSVMS